MGMHSDVEGFSDEHFLDNETDEEAMEMMEEIGRIPIISRVIYKIKTLFGKSDINTEVNTDLDTDDESIEKIYNNICLISYCPRLHSPYRHWAVWMACPS